MTPSVCGKQFPDSLAHGGIFLLFISPRPHRTAFQWLTVWSCVKLPSFIYVAPHVGSFAVSNFLFLSLGTEFHPSFVSPYMCCKFRFSFLKKKNVEAVDMPAEGYDGHS